MLYSITHLSFQSPVSNLSLGPIFCPLHGDCVSVCVGVWVWGVGREIRVKVTSIILGEPPGLGTERRKEEGGGATDDISRTTRSLPDYTSGTGEE